MEVRLKRIYSAIGKIAQNIIDNERKAKRQRLALLLAEERAKRAAARAQKVKAIYDCRLEWAGIMSMRAEEQRKVVNVFEKQITEAENIKQRLERQLDDVIASDNDD